MDLDDETLHVLSCDMSIRPRNAAGVKELLPHISSVQTDGKSVIVHFADAGREAVESFVNAERMCCTGLDWNLADVANGLQMTITGTAEQVEIIERWFGDPA